jgi:hypothetical protein
MWTICKPRILYDHLQSFLPSTLDSLGEYGNGTKRIAHNRKRMLLYIHDL